MEEVNILHADADKQKLLLHAVVEIFCILLLVALLSDPGFTRSAEDFLDLLFVPVAESANPAYRKNSGNMPVAGTTAKSVLNVPDLKNPVTPCTDGTCLLMEVATTNQSFLLEDSFNQNGHPIGEVKSFPVLAMAEEKSSIIASIAENPSDVLGESEINAVDFITPNDTQQNPLPEPASSDLTVSDPKLQDSVISERPSDTDMQIDSELPTGIQGDSKVISADVIQDSIQISEADPTSQTMMQEPLPEQPQTPKENIPGSIISQESPVIPSVPEITEPDSTQSDVSEPSDIEADTVEDTTYETPACFLMDETGMLFGFLPEYAEIQDGCLALPTECTGIRTGAFSGAGAGITELYIPCGTTMIEYGAFTGLDSLAWIEVESSNPVYTSMNGILFDSTTTVLLSFPAGRTDAYSLPEHVTQIADWAFTNTSLSRLDFRRCTTLFLGENIFGSSTGYGIVIAVPAESLSMYEDMLSTYAVTLTI